MTCDHIRLVERDVGLTHQLGVRADRYSVAWPRWMPQGEGKVNQGGVDFYQRRADLLLSKGIKPWLTLFHWDLPQALEAKGGWCNRDTARRFADYAYSVMTKLGDRVKMVMTLNEPNILSFQGYIAGEFPPCRRDAWPAAFRAIHHLLLAHGLGMQAIRAATPDAQVGMVLKMLPVETLSNRWLARKSASFWYTLGTRWFLDPLLLGSYPTLMRNFYRALPFVIQAEDMKNIFQPMDFIGLDYYFRQDIGPWGQWQKHVPGSEHTAMDWEVCPRAFTRGLIRLKNEYGTALPKVYITENGAAFDDHSVNGQVDDQLRIKYLRDHLIALHQAIAAGVDVRGYFLWTLIDNWEWDKGFTKKFGLVTRNRRPKASFHWYKEVIAHNGVAE